VAAQVLVKLGADLNRVRQQVIQVLGGSAREEAGESEAGGRPEAAGVGAGMGPEVRIVGSPAQLAEILNRLRSMDTRLAALERHLGLAAAEPGPAAREEPAPGSGPAAPPGDEGPAAQAGPPGG
jgi:hypothetical protein